jgi:hypothetical protein
MARMYLRFPPLSLDGASMEERTQCDARGDKCLATRLSTAARANAQRAAFWLRSLAVAHNASEAARAREPALA